MNTKELNELITQFDESGLSKIVITKKDFSVEMEKATGLVAAPMAPIAVAAPVAQAAVPVATTSAPATTISGDTINSPMVGTYYSAPSPDAAPFVKAGDRVKQGQVIAIMEAMKIMNEIEAEFDCKIVEMLAQDAQAVEYDMPLFVVEKL
jgi:acetyl-CoA carboxylase biotin carboxyl carrier protein